MQHLSHPVAQKNYSPADPGSKKSPTANAVGERIFSDRA